MTDEQHKLDAKQRHALKKFIKELEPHRGRHTELVTVYVPTGYDLNKVTTQLAQEQGLIFCMDKKVFDISWVSLWRVLFVIAFAVALYLIKDVLLVLFMALVISSALDAPISYLESKKIPRILATIFVFLAALSVLTLLLYTIVPAAIFEMKNLFEKLEELEIPAIGAFITPKLTEGIKSQFGEFNQFAVFRRRFFY